MNETDLLAKGFIRYPDGSWGKRPRAVGAVENPIREQNKRGESQDRGLEGGAAGVRFCVSIISVRHRLIDAHDNLRTGAKPLVDRITAWMRFKNDADSRLTWEYFQLRTTGPEGVIVVISTQS